MSDEVNGSCLCGKVTFKVTGPFNAFRLCYCSRCRRSTGSVHASNIFATPEQIQWLSGEENIKRFKLPEADRFTRCFCSECGSPVPVVSPDGARLLIPAGTLESDPEIRPDAAIFWPDRAGWYDDSLNARRYDRYPE